MSIRDYFVPDPTNNSKRGEISIVPARSGLKLTERICEHMRTMSEEQGTRWNVKPNLPDAATFRDGEIGIKNLAHDVRGKDVYVIQNFHNFTDGSDINDNIVEAILLGDLLKKRQGANKVTGVFPYPPYTRGDKPDHKKRMPIAAKAIFNSLVNAGYDQFYTVGLHAQQEKGFVDVPLDELDMVRKQALAVRGYDQGKRVIAINNSMYSRDEVVGISVDAGGAKIAQITSVLLGINVGIGDKGRKSEEETYLRGISGELQDKTAALIFDDVYSTGSSVKEVILWLEANTPIRDVYVIVTHFLHVGRSEEHLAEVYRDGKGPLKKIITTNTVVHPEKVLQLPYMHTPIELDEDLAVKISRIHMDTSISKPDDEPIWDQG